MLVPQTVEVLTALQVPASIRALTLMAYYKNQKYISKFQNFSGNNKIFMRYIKINFNFPISLHFETKHENQCLKNIGC